MHIDFVERFRKREEEYRQKRIAAEIAQKRIDAKDGVRASKLAGRAALAYAPRHPEFEELLRKAILAGSFTESEKAFLRRKGLV